MNGYALLIRFALCVAIWVAFNQCLILYITNISADKAWVFRVIGKDTIGTINKRFNFDNGIYDGSIIFFVVEMLEQYIGMWSWWLLVFAFAVSSISGTLARAMGLYSYWIARMDNDESLKTDIPDSLILEKLYSESEMRYGMVGFCGVLLALFLIVYAFAEFLHPNSTWRLGFFLCFSMLFCLAAVNLYWSQLCENGAGWLQMTAPVKFLRELSTGTVSLQAEAPINFFDDQAEAALRKRLRRFGVLKFLFALLICCELAALYLLLRL